MRPPRPIRIGNAFFLGTLLFAALSRGETASRNASAMTDLNLAELEERANEIEAELKGLARLSLSAGTGPTGYRSRGHEAHDHPEWVEIEFETEETIDQVVLVPTLWRGGESGFAADAFPSAFRILAGRFPDTNGTVVATIDNADQMLPRIAPLVIPVSPTPATWIRLETTQLSPRAWDGKFALQFSEIMAFRGETNVALGRPVYHPPMKIAPRTSWHPAYLTDGFTPYLMEAYEGKQSAAFIISSRKPLPLSFTIDLGVSLPVNRIHLHTVELGDNVPQAFPSNFGIPPHLRIEGANESSFLDSTHLVDYEIESLYEIGPILMRNVPESRCRFIRVTAFRPYLYHDQVNRVSRMAFSEIELFSGEQNVAIGKPVQINIGNLEASRSAESLTDGLNRYGRILPQRQWMEELHRRHELERERPLLHAEIARRHDQQEKKLRRVSLLAGLFAAGTMLTLLLHHNMQQRAIFRTRERIAADLHDELGASLHAIGLLSDLSVNARNDPLKLERHLKRLRELSQRTGTAARSCSNLLEARELYENLPEELRKTAERLMADLDHAFTLEGGEHLLRLSLRKRNDLYLFYKESLVNLLRHSGATQASTNLTATPQRITLVITDNGQGIQETDGTRVPPSLKRRARLLGAVVTVSTPESGGTSITLTLK